MRNPDLSGLSFYIKVFGCQMNRSDSEIIAGLLERGGAYEAAGEIEADIVVFLTCCVREGAETRVQGQIASMSSLPPREGSMIGRRIVAVGGCMAQNSGDALFDLLPNVDVVFGTHNIEELPGLVADALGTGRRLAELEDDGLPPGSDVPRRRETSYHAWLPIMKGCDNFCTYCIVPYVRGRERSRTIEDVAAEAKTFVEQGVREITLLGQNVNSYGRDIYGSPRFSDALRAVAETGIERLRFVTSHPKDLGDDTIAAMGELECVMPQLHLPVQSGSDRILSAMNRKYTAASYMDRVRALRETVDGIALSTDVIVGFPGETEEDFQATYDLVEEVGYSQVFTFIYSKRSGTPAAEMADDVPRLDVQRRFDSLVELVQKSARDVNQAELGQVVRVLVEGESKRDAEILSGRSPRNQTVHFRRPEDIAISDLVGKMAAARIDLARTWYLSGEVVWHE